MKLFNKLILIFSICLISIFLNSANAKNKLFYKKSDNNFVDLNFNEVDNKLFSNISFNLKRKDWAKSLSLAGSMKDESYRDTLIDYVLWKKFSSLDILQTEGEFSHLINFIQENQFLPNIQDLRLKAENIYANEKIPYIYAQKYFESFPPIQEDIAIKVLQDRDIFVESEMLNDLNKINLITDLNRDIKDVWVDKDFDLKQEQIFIKIFGLKLQDGDYFKKIEKLLWEKKYSNAERLFQFIGKDHRILYKSIIELNKNPKYINHILRSIPKDLRDNELLLYARVKYYNERKKRNDVLKVFYKMPNENFNHKKWWNFRNLYAREFLKTNDYKKAYYIASKHGLSGGGEEFAEAEWLSGWIALRFMKESELAYKHFYNLYNGVKFPISLSKASYWAGRALQEAGKEDKALYWYNISAKYPTYFYGQLGAYAKYEILNKTGLEEENHLPKKPKITLQDKKDVINNRVVKLAYLTYILESDSGDYKKLFKYSIENSNSKGQIAFILDIIKSLEDERLTTQMTKYAINKDVFFIEDLYPILKSVNKENPNIHLIHAIIKQESGFHVSAKSSVGALGFMQLMPQTAKSIAKRIGVGYNEKRLSQDVDYNIMLGSYYISSLLTQFKGSEVLAVASYNAGPNAVKRWIKLFGDPRKYDDIRDIVDWMESITYGETRNYVQRIIENSIVYEYVLE